MLDDIYTFRIDAYTPETIPMARLAEYMGVLANMMGEKDRVHFRGLEAGSTRVLSVVELVAAPKVRENIGHATSDDGSDAADSYKKINDMLRQDNAGADLRRGDDKIINFPGRKMVRPPKMGPFTQGVTREGILVRIGGKDKSAHAIIEDNDGRSWSFVVKREMAKELAHHLFGRPVRLAGQGRCFRDQDGVWQFSSLRAHEFELLSSSPLTSVVGKVRALTVDAWQGDTDPATLLQSLRDDHEETQ